MSLAHDMHHASPDRPFGTQSPSSDPNGSLRRSGRARKPPMLLVANAKDNQTELKQSPTARLSAPAACWAGPKRAPKRKASPETFETPADLLGDSLAPIRSDEQADWDSWVELESDPAFFNVIIRDLGVQDAKIQELCSLDDSDLDRLPQPVHGLIFLYQYVEDEATEPTEGGQDIWFANQTTDNACATVALLNIIMNAEGINLGEMLRGFQAESRAMSSPMRGHLLSNHFAIRKVHNSFARRLDLLNADLGTENEAKEFNKKRAKTHTPRKQKKPSNDAAFHFVAYVPVQGKVWQLNGLESHPVCIGEYKDLKWMTIARPAIEERMQQLYGLSFNLLALCQRPLVSVRQRILANARTLASLHARVKQHGLVHASHETEYCWTETELESYGLSIKEVKDAAPALSHGFFMERIHHTCTLGKHEVESLRRELWEEKRTLCAKYHDEHVSEEEDVAKATARKKDYTAAIHEWVTRLVEHGVLQELTQEAAENITHN